MQKIDYDSVGESLYKEILSNGLTVYYLPKMNYNKTYGLFTTNFGSLDTRFTPIGEDQPKTFPEGIAHFLEHKLFEKEDGDAMYKFGALGAQTNAFTSFSRTAYLFSTRENVAECVELLLDFVQKPYFTPENVAKEQGIIQQEIQMYQDDSDWRLYSGVLEKMYPNTPLAADIAGTPETINAITAEELYENYETFYHPSNMNLFVTGAFDVEEIAELVRKNQAQKSFKQAKPIDRQEVKLLPPVSGEKLALEVSMPKFALGLRGDDPLPLDSAELLRYKLSNQFLLNLLFGRTSQNYENLYNNGIIDDSFGFSFDLDERFHCASLTGDTENPELLSQVLQESLKNYKIDKDFTEEHLELLKREAIGDYFGSLNSLEYIANQFSSSLYGELNFFDLPTFLTQLTIDEIIKYADPFVSNMKVVEYTVLPK